METRIQTQPVIRQKDALEGCIEHVYWADALAYKYTSVYSLSLTYQNRKEKESITITREKERKDILLRFKEFRSWKTQGFRIWLVISCRTSDTAAFVKTASAQKLIDNL
jgi:hypothetical protein